MPNEFVTGKIALLDLVRVGGNGGITGVLPVSNVSISTKIETPEASSYASNGYTALVKGIQSAEISVEILYDKSKIPPIFAGMKADLTFDPTGGRDTFLGISPTSSQAALGTDEYKSSAASYEFANCTVTQVTYDVPVKDLQKVKLTLVPSAAVGVNFADVEF